MHTTRICTSSRRRRASLTALLAAFGLVACAQPVHRGHFGLAFPDSDAAHLESLLGRVAAAEPSHDDPLAYGVGGSPSELFVVDLESGELLWSEPAEITSWPHLAAGLLVTHEGDHVVAREARTGRRRLDFEDRGLELVGAAGEGPLGAFTLSTGGMTDARSELVIVRGTEVLHRLAANYAMGVPEMAAGMVLVPWGSQYLSFIDAELGQEVARVRLRGTVIGHAFTQGGDVYVGQNEIVQLTPALAEGAAPEGGAYRPPQIEWPGSPPFLFDPYQVPPRPTSAAHRVRLEFHAAMNDGVVGLTDDTLYALFHRVVFATDQATGAIRWARQLDVDLAGAQAMPGAILLAHVDGGVTILDAESGALSGRVPATHAASVMRIRLGRFTLGAPEETRDASLDDQLLEVVASNDRRLVPASLFALRSLGDQSGGNATAHLLSACERSDVASAVRSEACRLLASREEGQEAILGALRQRASFLDGTTTPPLAPVARAAAAMGAAEAIPLLIAHLRDPATPVGALAAIAESLGVLGQPQSQEALIAFIRLYHAETVSPEMEAALAASLNAIYAISPESALPLLAEISADATYSAAMRELATQITTTHRAAIAQAQAQAESNAAAAAAAEAEQQPQEPAVQLPSRLTEAMAREAIAPAMDAVYQCMQDAAVTRIRLVLVVNPDGSWAAVSTSPSTVRDCATPPLRAISMPAVNARARQRLSFLVDAPAASAAEQPVETETDAEETSPETSTDAAGSSGEGDGTEGDAADSETTD